MEIFRNNRSDVLIDYAIIRS